MVSLLPALAVTSQIGYHRASPELESKTRVNQWQQMFAPHGQSVGAAAPCYGQILEFPRRCESAIGS